MTTPLETIDSFLSVLGLESTEDCFEIEDGTPSLTSVGYDHILERVTYACNFKQDFLDQVDDGARKGDAEENWRNSWSELSSSSNRMPSNVKATVATWEISKFVREARRDQLNLNPTYQRDYVWGNAASQKLIKSILLGIPLPSIILYSRRDSLSMEVVDGKQRLTTILRFIGWHPAGRKNAKRLSLKYGVDFGLFNENYLEWKGQIRTNSKPTNNNKMISINERTLFFPFPLMGSKKKPTFDAYPFLKGMDGLYYCEIKARQLSHDMRDTVESRFEDYGNYLLPVIEFQNSDLATINQVFALYNNEGEKLRPVEVRNAKYHQLKFTKLMLVLSGDNDVIEEMAPYAKELNFEPVRKLLGPQPPGQDPSPGRPKPGYLQFNIKRFNRTRLVTWLVGLLMFEPNYDNKGEVKAKPTESIIEDSFKEISDQTRHRLRKDQNLVTLATWLVDGADLLSKLQKSYIHSNFKNTKGDGGKWSGIPAVSAWLACTLVCAAGKNWEDDVKPNRTVIMAKLKDETKKLPPFKLRTAKIQLAHISKIVLAFMDVFQINQAALGQSLEEVLGHNCIEEFLLPFAPPSPTDSSEV